MVFTPRRDRPAPIDGAIALYSDPHFGFASMTSTRKQVWADDLDYLRDRVGLEFRAHVFMGDITNDAGGTGGWAGPPPYIGAQDTEATAFFNAHFTDAPWYAAVGNHDIGNNVSGSLRLPDVAAHAWGMPAANYVVDLDVLRLIFICPDDGLQGDGAMVPFTTTRLDWIAAQAAASTRPVALVCHWNLKDTVTSSGVAFNYTSPPTAIATMLADIPNIKAWISGHTHSSVDNSLVVAATFGGHTVAAIDASGICYTMPEGSADMFTRVCSPYLTVYDDRLDVRFRDHGAGVWVSTGPDLNNQQRVWSVAV